MGTKANRAARNKAARVDSSSLGKSVLRWVIDIAIAVLIAYLITLVVRPTIVVETSMLPNFKQNDYLFIYKLAYSPDKGKLPEKGDVIVFESDLKTEKGKNKLLIKRVIGLPGDVIDIENGEVRINGELDNQSYTNDGYTPGDVEDYTVPEGTLFCLGDNRVVSRDSRDSDVGPVDMDRLVGKVVFRVYRFSEFGRIKNPYDSE